MLSSLICSCYLSVYVTDNYPSYCLYINSCNQLCYYTISYQPTTAPCVSCRQYHSTSYNSPHWALVIWQEHYCPAKCFFLFFIKKGPHICPTFVSQMLSSLICSRYLSVYIGFSLVTGESCPFLKIDMRHSDPPPSRAPLYVIKFGNNLFVSHCARSYTF